MKEVTPTFQTFYQLLKHIITRLRNNSMVEERTSGDFEVRFLLLKNELSQFNETDINEVLNTFSNQDERYEDGSVTLFEYGENETYYAIKSDKDKANTLQNIYANLWMLSKDTHKQELFMQFIAKTAECKALPLHKSYFPTSEGTGKYVLSDGMFAKKDEMYELCVEIFDKRQAFPKIADNEDKYRVVTATEQVVSSDKVDSKKEDTEQQPNKTKLRNICNKLILELIPQYLAIPKYKNGGFRTKLYQDIDVRIKEMFPKGASFTRNIFEEEWKKVIESDKEKYGFLSIAGNRWNKEEEN
jgi:hypothetical protein